MRVIKMIALSCAALLIGVMAASAQTQLANWTVVCPKYVSKGEVVPCDDMNTSANTFNFYKKMIVSNDQQSNTANLTFIRKDNNVRRKLKTVSVTPAQDPSNSGQAYWFTGTTAREGIQRSKRQMIFIKFHGTNYKCPSRPRECVVPEGEYTGTLKMQDTVSGDVFTINLSVQVVWPKPKS